mgnify:CR=1 FL=1
MTDEQLAQELRKSKGGKLGGKLLSLLGGAVAIAGIILGGNIVLPFWAAWFLRLVRRCREKQKRMRTGRPSMPLHRRS